MSRGSRCPEVAHQVLITSGPNRPHAYVIQRASGFTYVLNPHCAWLRRVSSSLPRLESLRTEGLIQFQETAIVFDCL